MPDKKPAGLLENPADTEELARIDAEIAAGGDPLGDHEYDVLEAQAKGEAPPPAPTTAPAPPPPAIAQDAPPPPSAKEPPTEDDGTKAPADDDAAIAQAAAAKVATDRAAAAQAAADATAAAAAPPPPPVVDVKVPEVRALPVDAKVIDSYKTDRAALRTERAELVKKFDTGEIDADTYNTQLGAIEDKLDDQQATFVRESAKRDQNIALEQQANIDVIGQIQALGKKQGVDYTADEDAVLEFDAALAALMRAPKNAALPERALYAKAHMAVLGARGISVAAAPAPSPAPAPAPNGKPPARVPAPPPLSLRNVPAAASTQGGSREEHFAAMSGPEFEAALAAMTPAEQAKFLGD